MGLVGDLYRAKINILLLVGKGDAAGCISNDAEEDEENSDNGCWLHWWPFVGAD